MCPVCLWLGLSGPVSVWVCASSINLHHDLSFLLTMLVHYVFQSVRNPLCHSTSLSVSTTPTLSFSMSLILSICLSIFLYLSVFLSLSVCLYPSVSLYLSTFSLSRIYLYSISMVFL